MKLVVNQVWEHRYPCRLCTGKEHHHKYVVLSPKRAHVMVRDVQSQHRVTQPVGDRHALPRDWFESLEKGGLRLVGHMRMGRFVPLPDAEIDDRQVEHIRVSLHNVVQWWKSIPGSAGDRQAA